MKKLLLLFLAIVTGMVNANAAKLYVNTSTNCSWWTNVRIYAYNSDSDNNGWDYSENGVVSSTTTMFGKEWYVFDMGNYNNAIVQYFESSNHNITNQSTDITNITHDKFILLPSTKTGGKWAWYENGFTFRSNVLNNWSAKSCNMEVVDANTLSYTLTKSVVDASSVDKIWFRILNEEGQIYPHSEEAEIIALPSSTSDYYNNWDGTSWAFAIEKPAVYDEIVVTATLSGTTWTISADVTGAGNTVTTNAYGFATFVNSNPLTISDATAYYATDTNDGSATLETISNPAAATPMLIKGDANATYRFTIAASGTTPSSNAFVAGPYSNLPSELDGKYNYILNGEGFYAANGKNVGEGKAYLQLSANAGPSAKVYFPNGDATSISSIMGEGEGTNVYYNLQGMQVSNPTKGMYIVNGKKYIVK